MNSPSKIETETENVDLATFRAKLPDGTAIFFRTRKKTPVAVLVGVREDDSFHVWRWTSSEKLVSSGLKFLEASSEFVEAICLRNIKEVTGPGLAIGQGSHRRTLRTATGDEVQMLKEATRRRTKVAVEEVVQEAPLEEVESEYMIFTTKKKAIDARPEGMSRKAAAGVVEKGEDGNWFYPEGSID